MLKIAYLWSQVTPYVIGVIEDLNVRDCEVVVVYWDNRGIHSKNWTPTIHNESVKFIPRSSLRTKDVFNVLFELSPDIIVISGWMDSGYINAVREYRRVNSSSRNVCCIDDQWFGSFRQILGVYYFRFFYRRIFDFMWISGKPQFSYAQRFGYNLSNIINNLYSGKFHYNKLIRDEPLKKRFVFIGRLVEIKGIMNLVIAYDKLSSENNNIWPLLIIGAGHLQSEIEKLNNPNILMHNYLGHKDIERILLEGGVGVLPSLNEPWGVVVHEFVQFGMPVILSDRVGASSEFLINGFNGYSFSNDVNPIKELEMILSKVMLLSDSELSNFSALSFELSKRITPATSAMELLSVLSRDKC
jgi:glycosyltransferase involved in cell wall biosynthesis